MERHTFLLRVIVLLVAAICVFIAFPAHGAASERSASRACAVAKGASSSAASSASASSTGDTIPDQRATGRGMSSSVTMGPNGLSGTTTMPDGSTVRITPGQATSTGKERAAADEQCIEPGTANTRPKQNRNGKQSKQPNHLKQQKENR